MAPRISSGEPRRAGPKPRRRVEAEPRRAGPKTRRRVEAVTSPLPHGEIEASLIADGCTLVGGVDEVGRGTWAGPVSVGVAVVDLDALARMPVGLRDSKQLTPAQREQLFPALVAACACWAIGHASPAECDSLGMTAAQALASRRAMVQLSRQPDAVVVDGKYDFTGHARPVVTIGGDRISLAVAAASVLAKVTRDAMLIATAPRFPGYALERNKGYASLEHRLAVAKLGLTSIHRKSWTFAQRYGDESSE